MDIVREKNIKKVVRDGYAKVAKEGSCGCSPVSSCCGVQQSVQEISRGIGYTSEDLNAVPEGSNLGLGCGNPTALASIKEGEVVLDLGSGAGFDCFLASQKVGSRGSVIGVDMTPEMIDKARQNKQKGNFENVEFRLGEIENLPVADEVADVVISNCVINLSPDKNRVFSEAFRALKSGGRLLVSDIVLLKELPDFIKNNESAYIGCLSGAIIMDDYLDAIKGAGFVDVKVIGKSEFPLKYITGDAAAEVIKDKMVISKEQIERLEDSILSIKVSGLKPAKGLNR